MKKKIFRILIGISILFSLLLNTITVHAAEECQHRYGRTTFTTEATCSQEGEGTKTCIDCGDVLKIITPKENHVFKRDVVEKLPEPGELGIASKTCKYCGFVERREINRVSNNFFQWVLPFGIGLCIGAVIIYMISARPK